MFSKFCRSTDNEFEFETTSRLSAIDFHWLEGQNLQKASLIKFVLETSKNHVLAKVTKANKPILFILLEVNSVNMEKANPHKNGIFGKISSHFFKNHSLNIATIGYSLLYDFNLIVADKNLLLADFNPNFIARCIDKFAVIYEVNFTAFQVESAIDEALFQKLGFEVLRNDFSMELELLAWRNFDEYQNELKRKYKKRAQNIRKNGEKLNYKALTTTEIALNLNKINELYLEVVASQKFLLKPANSTHFLVLKQIYGENFQIEGIYVENELVGFISFFVFGTKLSVHFIGINYLFNDTHDMYFNILFRTIELGINNKVSTINYGRTSLDAKASLGARPVFNTTLVKTFGLTKLLKNTIINQVKNFESSNWKVRKPFKYEEEIVE